MRTDRSISKNPGLIALLLLTTTNDKAGVVEEPATMASRSRTR